MVVNKKIHFSSSFICAIQGKFINSVRIISNFNEIHILPIDIEIKSYIYFILTRPSNMAHDLVIDHLTLNGATERATD